MCSRYNSREHGSPSHSAYVISGIRRMHRKRATLQLSPARSGPRMHLLSALFASAREDGKCKRARTCLTFYPHLRSCVRARTEMSECRVASRRCRRCVIVARTSQLFFNYPPADLHLRTVNVHDRQFITVNCIYSSLSWLLNFSHWAISIDLLRIVFPFCIVINLNVNGCNNFSTKIFLWIYLQIVDAICCTLNKSYLFNFISYKLFNQS